MAAGEDGVRLALGAGTRFWNSASPPLVTASPSLKAVRKGLSKVSSTAQAALFSSTLPWAELTGTSVGNCRAPSL